MKCPKCQAKLLPVDGEMFCLQCGTAVMPKKGMDVSEPAVEETTDPLLQKAITDSLGHDVKFKLPVSGAPQDTAAKAFVSMRQVLAPAPLAAAAGPNLAAAAPVMPMPVLASALPAPAGKAKDGPKRPGSGGVVEAVAGQLARGIVVLRALPKAWVAGLAVFGVFLVINGAIYAAYNNRVYPGVKVGQVDLSGVSFSELHSRLAAVAKPAALSVRVGNASYPLSISTASDPGRVYSVEMQVRDAGHSTPLPLAGMLETLVSKPLKLQPGLSSAEARAQAEQVAARVAYAPTPAAVMVVAGKVLLLSDKPGQSLDVAKAATAIQAAYGVNSAVGLQTQKLQPLMSAGDFAGEVDKAQAILGQTLKVHVKSAVYQPTASQVGDWLVIAGPGKGVFVNEAAVSGYVAALPGRFDRAGAVNAMVAAIKGGQSLDYNASTTKVSPVPAVASIAPTWPLAKYNYCLGDGVGAGDAKKVATVLADKAGWSMGGRLGMVNSKSSCNFSINIIPAAQMSSVDPACKGQSSCMADNVIVISDSAWKAAPAKWSGTLDSYRTELVNHEVGHWLGFEHTSCLAPAASAATPILSAPDVVVNGCSPNWYAIPAAQQRTKILPGFN